MPLLTNVDDTTGLALLEKAWEFIEPTLIKDEWPDPVTESASRYAFLLTIDVFGDKRHGDKLTRIAINEQEKILNDAERNAYNRTKTRIGHMVRDMVVKASYLMSSQLEGQRFPFQDQFWYTSRHG